MKDIVMNFLPKNEDIPIGLSGVNNKRIIALRLIDLKTNTIPRYSIYYHSMICENYSDTHN